jgi:hypothetical protein
MSDIFSQYGITEDKLLMYANEALRDTMLPSLVSEQILSGDLDNYLGEAFQEISGGRLPWVSEGEILDRGYYRRPGMVHPMEERRTRPVVTPSRTMPPRGGYKDLGLLKEKTDWRELEEAPLVPTPERLDRRTDMQVFSENTPVKVWLEDMLTPQGMETLFAQTTLQGGPMGWLRQGALEGITGYEIDELERALLSEEDAEKMQMRRDVIDYGGFGYTSNAAKKAFEKTGEVAGDMALLMTLGTGAGALTAGIPIPIARGVLRGVNLGAMHALAKKAEPDDSILNRLKKVPGEAAFFGLLDAGLMTLSQAAKQLRWIMKYEGKPVPKRWGPTGYTAEADVTAEEVQSLWSKIDDNLRTAEKGGTPKAGIFTDKEKAILDALGKMSPKDKARFYKAGGFIKGRVEAPGGDIVPRKPRMSDLYTVGKEKLPGGGTAYYDKTKEPLYEPRFPQGEAIRTRTGGWEGYPSLYEKGFRKLKGPEGGPDIFINPKKLWGKVAKQPPKTPPKQTPRLSAPATELPSPSENIYFVEGAPIRTRVPLATIEEHAKLGSAQATEALDFIKQHEGQVQFGEDFGAKTVTGKTEKPKRSKAEMAKIERGLREMKRGKKPRVYKNTLYQAIMEISSGGIKPSTDFPHSALKKLKLPVGMIRKDGMTLDDIASHFNDQHITGMEWLRTSGDVMDTDLYNALADVRDRRDAGLVVTEEAMDEVGNQYEHMTDEDLRDLNERIAREEAVAGKPEEATETIDLDKEEVTLTSEGYAEEWEDNFEPEPPPTKVTAPKEPTATEWPEGISEYYKTLAKEDFKSLESLANAGDKKAQAIIDHIRETGQMPGTEEPMPEPEIEYMEAGEGAMQHGQGDVSVEELQRQKSISFYKWNPKSNLPPVKIPGSGAVDVPVGRNEVKFQLNLNTGKPTLLDKGEGVENVTAADIDKLAPFIEKQMQRVKAARTPVKAPKGMKLQEEAGVDEEGIEKAAQRFRDGYRRIPKRNKAQRREYISYLNEKLSSLAKEERIAAQRVLDEIEGKPASPKKRYPDAGKHIEQVIRRPKMGDEVPVFADWNEATGQYEGRIQLGEEEFPVKGGETKEKFLANARKKIPEAKMAQEEGRPKPQPKKETDLFGREEPKKERPVKIKKPEQKSFYDVAGIPKEKIENDFKDLFDEETGLKYPAPFGSNKRMTFNSPKAFENQVKPAIEKGYKVTYNTNPNTGKVTAEISGKPGGEGRLVSTTKPFSIEEVREEADKKEKAEGKQDKFDFSGQKSLTEDPNYVPEPPKGLNDAELDAWWRAYFAQEVPPLLEKWKVPEELYDKIMDDFLRNYRYDRGDPPEAFLRNRLSRYATGREKWMRDRTITADTTDEATLKNMTTASEKKSKTPEDEFELKELRSKAIDAIEGLKTTPKNKKFLRDRIVEGKSIAKIAAENGETTSAVSKAINRQIERLNEDNKQIVRDFLRTKNEYKHLGVGPMKMGAPLRTQDLIRNVIEVYEKLAKGKDTRMGRLREREHEMIQRVHSDLFLAETYYKDLRNFIRKADNKEDMREYVRMFLAGEADVDLSALPDKMKSVVKKARAHIDGLTLDLIANGNLEPETERIFRHNLGSYLVGKYEAYLDPNWKPDPKKVEKFKEALKANVPDMADYTDKELDNYVYGILNSIRREGMGSKKGGRIPSNIFKQKKDLWQSFKEMVGEVDDIAYIYLATIQKLTVGANKARLLNQIAETYRDLWTMDETEAGKKGWQNTRLPNEAGYGKLKGAYVDPVVKEFIQEDLNHHYHWLERAFMKYLINPWKINRTIGSVPTHARNTLGNIFFSLLSGTSPTNPLNFPYYRKAVAMLSQKGKHREEWARLMEIGVVGNQFYGTEIPKIMGELLEKPTDQWLTTMKNKAKELGRKGFKKVANLYNAEDAVYRVAAYYKLKDKGYTDKQATAELDRTFPNYLKLPAFVDTFRKYTVLGPFVSFMFNVMKITASQFARGIAEVEAGLGGGPPLSGPPPRGKAGKGHDGFRGGSNKHGGKGTDPRLFFRGLTRFAALGAILSGPYILSEISKIVAGVDKDFQDKLQELQPAWRRNRVLFYFRDKSDKIKTIDLTYIHPWGQQLSAFRAALKGDIESIGDYLNFMTNPLLEIYQIGILNQDPERFNMPVGNAWDKAKRVFQSVWLPQSAPVIDPMSLIKEGKIRPSDLTPRQIRKLIDAYWKQPTDQFGTVDNFSEELVAFFTGIRTTEVEPAKILYRYAQSEAARLDELDKRMVDYWKNNSISASDDQLVKQLKKWLKGTLESGQRMSRYYKFMEKYKGELSGVPMKDVKQVKRDYTEVFDRVNKWLNNKLNELEKEE